MKRIYVCENEVTGLFSALYDAWKYLVPNHGAECGIRFRGHLEQELFCEYTEVESNEKKALSVERMILSHMGWYTYKLIYQAALSDDPDRGDVILGTMLAAREIPDSRRIMDHLGNAQVEQTFELSRTVNNETTRWIELIRFRELEQGILYARFEPKCRVLSCVAPHFAERLSVENWMIHDAVHEEYAVHEAGRQWILVSGEHVDETRFSSYSVKEEKFSELWKEFTDAIAIKERKNPRCQMGHLPLWCRKNLVEFE